MFLFKQIPSFRKQEERQEILNQLKNFVHQNKFAIRLRSYLPDISSDQLRIYNRLGTVSSAEELTCDIRKFLKGPRKTGANSNCLLAVFRGQDKMTDAEFERLTHRQLRLLHQCDHYPLNSGLKVHSKDKRLKFTFSGRAFTVDALHPESSNAEARSPYICLCFRLIQNPVNKETVAKTNSGEEVKRELH